MYKKNKFITIFLLSLNYGLIFMLNGSTLATLLSDYGISKSIIGLFTAITVPYAIKFLWSPIFDIYDPPFLSKKHNRKQNWLIIIQTLTVLTIIKIGINNPTQNMLSTTFFAFVLSFLGASQESITGAYRAERFDETEQGSSASISTFAQRIGMLLAGGITLILTDYFRQHSHYISINNGWGASYMIMATIITINSIIIHILNKDNKNISHAIKYTRHNIYKEIFVEPFNNFIKNKKNWHTIILILALYRLGDTFAAAMINNFLLDIGFSLSEIGAIVKSFGIVAIIVGGFCGGIMINKIGIKKTLFICAILQAITNFSYMMQNYFGHNTLSLLCCISIENVAGGMGGSALVAYISSICNKKYSASQYAIASSITAFGENIIPASSGIIADILNNWYLFFTISIICSVPSIILTYKIIEKNDYIKKTAAII